MMGHLNRRLPGIAAALLAAVLLVAGCTTTSRRDAGSAPDLPAETIDTTEPNFDPAEQLTTANTIRDQLRVGGVDCEGTAGAPPGPDDQIPIGVIAQLNCPYDGGEIQIVVYRTEKAKQAGLERLAWLACMGKWKAAYVDGDVWVVGTVIDGKDESDPAMTKRIATALDSSARTLAC